MGDLHLLAWRRATAATYRRVREEPDPATAHALWVRERQALFASSPQSPSRTARLVVAPYDPAYRAVVELEPAPPERLEVVTGTDGVVPFERVGVLRTPWGPLDAWWLASYGGGLWVPVRAGRSAYGGGRYLYDTVKGADLGSVAGALVVDLNFLYNPSCAYDEAWACPLAPPGDRLELDAVVGELEPER